MAARKSAAKRELIEPTPGDKRYVRRDAEGKFNSVVDVGRSLAADRRSKSKSAVAPGQGDKGDVVRSASARSAAKSSAKTSSKKSSAKAGRKPAKKK